MINKIEKLRKDNKISKAKFARECNISTSMYYKYLHGSELPCSFVVKALNYFGKSLYIIDNIEKL